MPETNRFLHIKFYPTRTIVVAEPFLHDLLRHRVAEAVFFVNWCILIPNRDI